MLLSSLKLFYKNILLTTTKRKLVSQNLKHKPPWKILFFGSDDFSLASLKLLRIQHKLGNLVSSLEIVTVKSNGKKPNPVERFAIDENLAIYGWSKELTIKKKFHIGLVVSFGHLIPAKIINSFPLGVLNVHASLLPRWRGAAPIIYAIANGDTVTGVTIMKIKPEKFDVGDIVQQSSISMSEHVKLPEMYHCLANLGAKTLIETIRDLQKNLENAIPQPKEGVTLAPKINFKSKHIDWNNMTSRKIYNLERAYFGVAHLTTSFNNISPVKLFNINLCEFELEHDKLVVPGRVKYNKQVNKLLVQCFDDKWITIEKIGIHSKKITASDFNNGFLSKCLPQDRIFR